MNILHKALYIQIINLLYFNLQMRSNYEEKNANLPMTYETSASTASSCGGVCDKSSSTYFTRMSKNTSCK